MTMPSAAAATLPSPRAARPAARASARAKRSCARRPSRTPRASAASAPSACRRRRTRRHRRDGSPVQAEAGRRTIGKRLELAVNAQTTRRRTRCPDDPQAACRAFQAFPRAGSSRCSCRFPSFTAREAKTASTTAATSDRASGCGDSAPTARRADRRRAPQFSARPCGATSAIGLPPGFSSVHRRSAPVRPTTASGLEAASYLQGRHEFDRVSPSRSRSRAYPHYQR